MSTERIDVEALRGHTQGTWSLGKAYGNHGVEVVGDDGNRMVCGVIGVERDVRDKDGRITGVESDPEGSANARLFVAAPALLAEVIERRARDAAVEELVETVKDARESMAEGYGIDWQRIDAALDAIQGAQP